MPLALPKLNIARRPASIFDYTFEDFRDRELSASSGHQGARRGMTRKSKKKANAFDQSQPKRGGPPIPTSPLVEVRNSEVHGRGVFAVARHQEGHAHLRVSRRPRVPRRGGRALRGSRRERQPHVPVHRRQATPSSTPASSGNDARFINHQCDRQLRVGHREPPRVHRRRTRDIAPGEELGYDYEIGRDKDDPPNVDEIYACRCGSPKCRGTMLMAAPKKTAAKRRKPKRTRRRKPGKKRRKTGDPRRSVAENGHAGAPDRSARRTRVRRC